MAKRDKDGNWTFDPEEESQIEILARARVRARHLQKEEDAAEKAALEEEEKKNPKKKKTGWGAE